MRQLIVTKIYLYLKVMLDEESFSPVEMDKLSLMITDLAMSRRLKTKEKA